MEDLLLQVLVRLRCARAAARTGLLSRRWRGLWSRLPSLTFRDVALGPLLPALASLQAPAGVSFLDILVAGAGHAQEAARVSSLLRAGAGLSPAEFRQALPRSPEFLDVDLPRFHRATSIELHGHYLRLTLPPRTAGFPALQRLSLSGCRVDLAGLIPLCPRLRVLAVAKGLLDSNITVKSESLEELAAANVSRWTGRIDVDAPMLKKLTLSFSIDGELSVSIVAPIVDKVSWECIYSRLTVGLDPWSLSSVSLHAAAEVPGEDGACLQQHSNVLSLQMWACGLTSYPDAELTFEQEIEKHLVTSEFSVLELLFTTMEFDCDIRSVGHVFGSLVLRLLGMHRIRTATQKLKIIFQRPEVKAECPVNCPCDEPKNWRSKDISLINLEQVEIEGLEGEDHEFDFLKVIFRCAPMLKRMAVRMSDAVRTSNDQCSKIYDIFRAYPSVECNVDRTYGSMHNS